MEEKMNYEKEIERLKEEVLNRVEDLRPDLRNIMCRPDESLKYQRLENMAKWIARHCDEFNQDQRDFVYLFVKASVIYLHKECLKSDYTFLGLHKLIDTVEFDEGRYICSTYECLIEKALSQTVKGSRFRHDYLEVLKLCHQDYIHPTFKEVVHKQVDDWKSLFFDSMIKDEDYKEMYTYLKGLENAKPYKAPKDEKVRLHLQNGGLFRLTYTTKVNENPRYDYDEFDNQLIRFQTDPFEDHVARWWWLGDDGKQLPESWRTSLVQNVQAEDDTLKIETLNSKYYFKIHEEKEAV